MNKPIAIVVGAGPGLGASIVKRFAKEGYPVAMLARSTSFLTSLSQEVSSIGGRVIFEIVSFDFQQKSKKKYF
jgi:short-subunit dehydrogenase